MPANKPKLNSISLTVAKKSTPKARKAPNSSFHRFVDEYRPLAKSVGADSSFKAVKPTWDILKSEAKSNGLSEDQVKKFQTQPAVNGKIKVLTPTEKGDRLVLFAVVSVNKKGDTGTKIVYKSPAMRASMGSSPLKELARILRSNASVSVQDMNAISNQVKSNLEPGTKLSDIVIRQEGKKIQIYAPSKKGFLKVVETLNIK